MTATATLDPVEEQQLADANQELSGEESASTATDVPVSHARVAAEPVAPPAELRRRHYEEIVNLNRQVGEAWHEWQNAKAEAAELKKGYDGLVQQLRKTVARDPLQRDVFDAPSEVDGDADPWAAPGDEVAGATGAIIDSDAWRLKPVGELGAGRALTSKLEHHHIETLGDLQDFWSAGKDLKDLKGIGEESAAKVADAFAEYSLSHRELWEQRTADAGGDDFNAEDPLLSGGDELASDDQDSLD